MTIKYKLNIILFLVISFSLIILGVTVKKAYGERETIMRAEALNLLSQKMSLLIHETQKERGASAGYIGSQGQKFAQIVQKQRVVTDRRDRELREYLEHIDLNSFPSELRSEIVSFRRKYYVRMPAVATENIVLYHPLYYALIHAYPL